MFMRSRAHLLAFFAVVLVAIPSLRASALAKTVEIPKCDAKDGSALKIDNGRVVVLKNSTPNQFAERARVEGRVSRIFSGNPEHQHFEIQIGPGPQDTLEVVFNLDFGRPEVKQGDLVEACGDYITSNAPTERYQASPSGAIVHWVHENARGGSHPDGYIVVNDRLMYGFGRLPLDVDGTHDQVPSVPGASQAPTPAPAPAPGYAQNKKKRKKERRPSAGRDDPEYEKLPRHGRNWRDWVDEDRS
ncbi:DUF3465 domain-containing protein [bacterium]|nr:DUF3465 domain-containing protein [bacterium]